MESDESSELNASELGTKEYWDRVYQDELDNFADHGDVGEVWFGEESIFRITEWLRSNPTISKNEPVVDLGCGNGMMLVELARDGFQNLLGVDYSEQAVQLASSIIAKQNMNSIITFKACDLLTEEFEPCFALALDKGTYDAICLNPDSTMDKRLSYIQKVHDLLKPNGLLIITSCNWTEDELISHFKNFKLYAVIPTPEFKFGGKIGKLVSCIVLQKIN